MVSQVRRDRRAFETVLSAKASSMVPVTFKAFKSNIPANGNSIRIVDMPTT